MRDIVREYQERFRQNRQQVRRYTALLLALALTTSLFVNWQLHGVGVAKTADYQCGEVEHQHTAECYEKVLVCGYEEGEPEDWNATVPDDSAPMDDAFGVDAADDASISAYSAEPEYIFVPHEHTDDCYQEVQELTCWEEEHVHTDDCFDPEDGSLICNLFEHTHDDSCYTTTYELVCGLEEGELVEEPNPDYVPVDEDAFAVFDSGVSILPAADMKPVAIDDSSLDVPVHHHTDDCYEEVLICGLPEHHHTVNCLSDPQADVEDEDDWLAQTGTVLSSIWTDDLLTVAKGQLGYEQSERNFQLDDEDGKTVRHYTRYGAWYGNPYGEWDVMFLSYCLNFASIPQSAIPQEAGTLALHSKLRGSGAMGDFNGDMPIDAVMPGDIVIYSGTTTETVAVEDDTLQVQDDSADADIALLSLAPVAAVPQTEEHTVTADTVGIVSDVDYEAGTLTVISGNVDGKVAEVSLNASQVSTLVSVATAQAIAEDGAELLDPFDPSTSLDISLKINNFYLQKKTSNGWIESDEFTLSDQVRANFEFSGISAKDIKDHNYTAYIPLPDGIDCSKLTGGYITDDTYTDGKTDSNGHHISGRYSFVQVNGHYVAVLEYLPEYINQYEASNTTVRGDLNFEFSWDEDHIKTDEKNVINVGNKNLTITIKKDETPDETQKNFSLKKSAGKLSYDASSKTAYIDYTVELTVKQEMSGPLTMSDVLTSAGFDYVDNSLKIDPTGTSVSWAAVTDSTGRDITIGSSDAKIQPGTYKITYRVEKKNFAVDSVEGTDVKNVVSMKYEDESHSDDTKTSTETNLVTKTGKVSTDKNGDRIITWTVELNNGSAKRYLEKAKFTDQIEAGQEYIEGSFEIKENGKTLDSSKLTFENGKLSYDLNDGYNSYKITYKTKVTTTDIPLDGVTVTNTGNIDGNNGLHGSDTGTVKVQDDLLKKEAVGSPSINGNTATLQWKAHIDVEGLEGYLYQDYSGTLYDNEKGHYNPQKIDLDNIHIIVTATGEDVTSKAQISEWSHMENGAETGLFQIDFTGSGITGPVDIIYTTTVDVSDLSSGSTFTVANHSLLTKGDHSQGSDASHTIKNVDDKSKSLLKFAGGPENWNETGSGSTKLEVGQKLQWTVVLNHGDVITSSSGDWVIEDTLPKGLILDKTSIELNFNYHNTRVEGTDYEVNFLERDGRTVIQVVLHPSAYMEDGKVLKDIYLMYKTTLDPESDFCTGDDASHAFTNDASFSHDNTKTETSFTETITRNVIGKHGDYDPVTRLLSYNIDINPDGAKLSADNSLLDVEDTLKIPSGLKGDSKIDPDKKGFVHLEGISLFTGERQADGSLVAVDFVCDLTRVNDKSLVDVSSYFVDYNSDESQITFHTKVKDGTPYVLVAHYSVLDKLNGYTPDGTFTFSNSVQLASSWKAEDNSQQVKFSSGSTSGIDYNSDRMTIFKYSGNQSNPLAGAVFELKHWDGSSWQLDQTVTTDSTGQFTLGTLVRGRLYRLEETSAPAGYILPDHNEQYFYIAKDAGGYTPPAEAGVDADKLIRYTVEDNVYQNFFIYRNNARNPEYVKHGDLLVKKAWQNHDGSAITDTDDMPEVIVKLTKHTRKLGNTITVTGGGLTYTYANIADGSSLDLILYNSAYFIKNEPLKLTSLNGSTISAFVDDSNNSHFRIDNITADDVITVENTVNSGNVHVDWFNPSYTTATEAKVIDTVVDTVQLDKTNNWSYRWEGLEMGDDITYTLTEQAVTGYTASYTLNSQELAEGAAFHLGTKASGSSTGDGDTVVITNTAEESGSYELPSTGGAGTTLYTAGGVALMLTALVCWVCRKRRRERGLH